jgi:hypothetical protein
MSFDPVAFQTAFPQFATTPTATITGWANLAQNSAMGDWFGSAMLTEQQLLVAHMGALMTNISTQGTTPTGALVSAGEGGVSAGFTPPPVKTGWQYWLSSTPYGVQLWGLLVIAGMGGDLVGGLPERAAFRKASGIWC